MVLYYVFVFKKNLNASKPSEHPPSGEKMSKVLGGNIGCRRQNLFMVSNGFPNVTTSGQQYNIGENLFCLVSLHVLNICHSEKL